MYIFHRTSKEKIQSEAPLLVVSWNFISTVERMRSKKKEKKKKYPTNRKRQDIIFLLVSRGWGGGAALAVHVLVAEVRGGHKSANVRLSLAPPNFLPVHAGPEGNIHAVCVRREEVSTVVQPSRV